MALVPRTHNEYAHWIMAHVAELNPYNVDGLNRKSEYYIYQMGFMASYLASVMQQDPMLFAQFKRHLTQRRNHQGPVKKPV